MFQKSSWVMDTDGRRGVVVSYGMLAKKMKRTSRAKAIKSGSPMVLVVFDGLGSGDYQRWFPESELTQCAAPMAKFR